MFYAQEFEAPATHVVVDGRCLEPGVFSWEMPDVGGDRVLLYSLGGLGEQTKTTLTRLHNGSVFFLVPTKLFSKQRRCSVIVSTSKNEVDSFIRERLLIERFKGYTVAKYVAEMARAAIVVACTSPYRDPEWRRPALPGS